MTFLVLFHTLVAEVNVIFSCFDNILTESNVVGTPDSSFAPSGEGFFRLSAFGHRENLIEAVEKIKTNLSRLNERKVLRSFF